MKPPRRPSPEERTTTTWLPTLGLVLAGALFVPSKTPAAQVPQLNREVQAAVNLAAYQSTRLRPMLSTVRPRL